MRDDQRSHRDTTRKGGNIPTNRRTEDVQRGIAFMRAQLVDDACRLLPHVVRLLAEGEPVALDRLATAAGMSVAQVREHLKDPRNEVEWDEGGRVAGWGLTLRTTQHTFTFDGATLFGWCATDVLWAPVVLDRSGVVESTCPATGERIRVDVTPEGVVRVDPSEAVVSEVRPLERTAEIRTDICGVGHFFSSREAAAGWLEKHPQGQVNSVVEDFEIHRRVAMEVGWVA